MDDSALEGSLVDGFDGEAALPVRRGGRSGDNDDDNDNDNDNDGNGCGGRIKGAKRCGFLASKECQSQRRSLKC